MSESTLVITSHPHALGHITYYNADRRIIVLGFTEEEQCDFVKCYLKNQSEKVPVVLDYLHMYSHSTINSLCCIPFNLNVLLHLYKQELALPKTLLTYTATSYAILFTVILQNTRSIVLNILMISILSHSHSSK